MDVCNEGLDRCSGKRKVSKAIKSNEEGTTATKLIKSNNEDYCFYVFSEDKAVLLTSIPDAQKYLYDGTSEQQTCLF